MDDEPSLLAAVLAEPGDDLPRLVYADWLDEFGRFAQANFVRDQVAGRVGPVVFCRHYHYGSVSWKPRERPRCRPGLSYIRGARLQCPGDLPRDMGVDSAVVERGFVSKVWVSRYERQREAVTAILAGFPVTEVRAVAMVGALVLDRAQAIAYADRRPVAPAVVFPDGSVDLTILSGRS